MLLLPLMAILLMGSALACSCIAPVSIEESFNNSDMVFAGVVNNINDGNDYDPRSVYFTVDTYWKKDSDNKGSNSAMKGPTIIHTGRDSAMCGFEFEEGKKYLVYATRNDDGDLTTSLCSRTISFDQASEDLAFLGVGTDVSNEPTSQPNESWFSRIIIFFRNLFR